MAFLDPARAELVRRSFKGPARIRGAAGTGKPSSACDAYLARATDGRVLFRTYISTLPKVLESLPERLAPDMVGRVDFIGVHAFASRLVSSRLVSSRERTRHRVPRSRLGGPARVRRRVERAPRLQSIAVVEILALVLRRRDQPRHQGPRPDAVRRVRGPGSNRAQAGAPAGDSPSCLGSVRGVRAACASDVRTTGRTSSCSHAMLSARCRSICSSPSTISREPSGNQGRYSGSAQRAWTIARKCSRSAGSTTYR